MRERETAEIRNCNNETKKKERFDDGRTPVCVRRTVLVAMNFLRLLRPGEVVRARLGAGVLLDDRLEPRPEADHFQRPIEPAGGN